LPFIAPVLMTVFTLALHAVGPPFLGAHPTNLAYLRVVKILFAVQLVAAAGVFVAIVAGITPVTVEERIMRVEATQGVHTAQLHSLAATQGNHTAQLHGLTALVRAVIKHFNITTT
jgi:hypothetical protein